MKNILFLFLILFFSCDQGQLAKPNDFQTVRKGNHYVPITQRIIRPRIAPDSVGWIIRFMPNCAYILYSIDGSISVDQLDWNKTCGEMFHSFDPHVNTAMLGWRHNLDLKKIEVNFYHHISRKVKYTEPLYAFAFNEEFEYRIVPNYTNGTITETLWTIDHQLIRCIVFDFPDLKNRFKILANEINFYFGGNQVASQDVTVMKKYINY